MAQDELRVSLRLSVGEGGQVPAYATEEAAGMDLRSTHAVTLQPMERALVKTGLRAAIPRGYEGQVRPRSGLALKQGITCLNSPGTIDSDYRGEIGVILINLSDSVVQLDSGERIAQLVICPIARAEIKVVDSLDETERGEGGFGSTGLK
ncbi:deoxyuridine 5'-triphosphate nucleotidohydrolase [Armatimonadetes bacterium Uphvl-Ar1]|nr:deoxyuridine 5'-triphosphate nucleotidohydrolase [Armatimonadetes bacterium Uphvl-Ar1]